MLLKIYNPSGKLVTATQDFSYSGAAMGEKTISSTLLSAQKLNLPPNSYAEFRGEKYLVRNEPSIKRTSATGIRGDAFQTSIVFTSKQYELVDCDFMDYVLNDDMYYTGMDSFSFYGDVYDLCRRIQANLDGQYSGAERWVILMPCKGYDDPQPVTNIGWGDRILESETLQISPSNENCWNALTRSNSDFGFFFYLDTAKKLIYVGVEYPEFRVENELITFEYGKGNGLYEIQRDVEANTVITKLRVKGSDRNIDRNYLRNESFPRFTQNLQLPVFRDTRHQARPTDYLLANQNLIDYFGVRPGSKTFDDIYPSIEGMVDANNNPIDTIGGVEDIDDTIKENGDLVQSYFYVYLYDLGFDINEYLTSEDATLSMKTGYCVTNFKIVEASPLSSADPHYADGCRWKFRLEKDVTSSANYILPSGNVKPKKGDKFVLLYILMPESYVTGAEERLEEAAQKYLDENSRSKISYTVNLDEIYLANRPIVARALKEAISMRIVDNELGDMEADDGSFYTVKSVQNLVITYKAEQQIPSYQITLAEKIISNPINRIENEIGNIAENVQNNGSQNTVNRRNGIRNSRNLRALRDKIFDTDGYFDPENIRPNSIETGYLAVGAKSRDFTTNKISMKAYKEDDVFKVSLSTGYINHRALWWGGGDEAPADVDKFTWGINDAASQELSENDKDYYIYVKAERSTGLAEWFVSTDKLQYDFDKDYYYLLLGVIYPVQEDRRDISLVNGMAYISGGAIYGDVIKSINYVDDDSNEGSMYDLNNGKVRLGNKFKGLLIDIVNKVFLLFGVTLEFKNANDELVSKIDGDTGAAMFGKGANTFSENGDVSLSGGVHKFNADKSMDLAGGNILYDLLNGLRLMGKFESNKDGNCIVIDPVTRSLRMLHGDLVIFELDFFVNDSFAGPRMKFYLYNMQTGKIHTSVYIDGGAIKIQKSDNKVFFIADAYQSKIWIDAESLPQGRDNAYPREVYMDGETLKVFRYTD
ncbi:hypothetical protein M2132_001053 [Dysgonomonas sp. PH5-45]|uniref:hypothetical protein n=1 Tax=unclassified Dysgonomonas TaxID=2630389 RepID=UPI0024751681|nr:MULTISPECIES: hypothetical protein [unclassified Dysgonomonas]MDH6354724.1 hypothetical protein [Dysgonomonas sp. PH5-45]MDH6387623.1 hypothetical protein [Dysgonomonas sp. PH5-37]